MLLLARDVLSERTPALSVERAEEYLGVVHKAVEERRAGSFDALFHALVDITPEPTEGWAGSLIHMAENWWGRSTHRADRLLVHEEAVGKTWLGHLLSDKERSLGPLERLVNLARTEMPADATPAGCASGPCCWAPRRPVPQPRTPSTSPNRTRTAG